MGRLTIVVRGLGELWRNDKLLGVFDKVSSKTLEQRKNIVRENPVVRFSNVEHEIYLVILEQIRALSFGCEVTREDANEVCLTIFDPQLREIANIKDMMHVLEKRIDKVEDEIYSRTYVSDIDLDQIGKRVLKKPEHVAEPAVKLTNTSVGPIIGKKKSYVNFEEFVGKVGLNVIGIVLLVLGVAFLVGYAAKDFLFSPLGRICGGAIASIALIGFGKYFSTKEKFKQYSYALLGGGWAGLYLVVYCVHHVDVVSFVKNPFLGFGLLLVVAGLMLADSVRYDSLYLTMIGGGLAFLASFIHQATMYSVCSAFVVAIILLATSYLKEWNKLPLLSFIGLYLAYMRFSQSSVLDLTFSYELILLSVVWGLFYLVTPIMSLRKKIFNNTTNVLTIANGTCCAVALQFLFQGTENKGLWVALVVVGLLYVVRKAIVSFYQKQKITQGADVVLAILFFSYAGFLKLSGISEVLFYAFEILVVTELANQFKDKKFSFLAVVVSMLALIRYWVMVSVAIPVDLLFGLSNHFIVGVSCFAALLFAGIRANFCANHDVKNGKLSYDFLDGIGLGFLVTCLLLEFKGINLYLVMSGVMLLIHEVGFWYKSVVYSFVANLVSLVVLVMFVAYTLFDTGNLNYADFFLSVSVVGWKFVASILAFVWVCIRYRFANPLAWIESSGYNAYRVTGVAAVFMLIAWLVPEVNSRFYASVWGVEAFLVLILGFVIKDKVFRCAGLAVFCLVLGKLFFFDIVGLSIVLKICSFIGLGVVLLVASYLYNKLCLMIETDSC